MTEPAQAQADLSRRIGTTVADTGAPGYRFESFVLNSADEQRRYRIRLAVPDRSAPQAGFAAAFLLDGNAALMEVDARLLAELSETAAPPLLVFISYDDDLRINAPARTYDYTPRRAGGEAVQVDVGSDRRTGGAGEFLDFISEQVMPQVEQRVPLDRQRQAVWGHSYGGLWVLHTLFTRPQMFDWYVAVDPSLWWGQGYAVQEATSRRVPVPPGPKVMLMVGRPVAGQEASRIAPVRGEPSQAHPSQADAAWAEALRRARAAVPADAAEQLAKRLQQEGLAVDYRVLPGLSHGQTLGASLPVFLREFGQASW